MSDILVDTPPVDPFENESFVFDPADLDANLRPPLDKGLTEMGEAPGSDSDDLLIAYTVGLDEANRHRKADGIDPIQPEAVQAWLDSLSDEERTSVDNTRAYNESLRKKVATVHDKLTETVPELYEARLPSTLEARLREMRYALGFNQTMASNVDEAADYLVRANGINLAGYSPRGRFSMYSQDNTDSLGLDSAEWGGVGSAIEYGYTLDPDIGRFVVAFPEALPAATSTEKEAAIPDDPDLFPEALFSSGGDEHRDLITDIDMGGPEILPADFFRASTEEAARTDHAAVNPKYIAGFIDGEGDFWVNSNFAMSDKLAFVRAEEFGATAQL